MQLSPDSQAIVLLTMRFSAGSGQPWTPLTPKEYARFALWLQSEKRLPRDLLARRDEVLVGWQDDSGKVPRERLDYLLARGVAMGVALEKWDSVGIWALTRADAAYPARLKQKLGSACPAVLLGVGEARLLNTRGIAVVGSRGLGASESAFAEEVARAAAQCGFSVVSGGAKGADEIAMQAGLAAGGTVVGVLAASLMREATAKRWRAGLRDGSLCLVTPFYPEAPFQVGNAMARNKYVYALADCGVVVRSDFGKGGTWTGATEALKNGLGPVFVNPEPRDEGCAELIKLGASTLRLPESKPIDPAWMERRIAEAHETASQVSESALSELDTAADPFQAFVQFLLAWLHEEGGQISRDQVFKKRPDLAKARITAWLNQAAEEGLVVRPSWLAKYELPHVAPEQLELFDG